MEIQVLITYDQYGVTDDPNNKVVYEACKSLQKDTEHKVNIMTLYTVGRCRRNLSYADIQNIEYDKFHFFNFDIIAHNAALRCHQT